MQSVIIIVEKRIPPAGGTPSIGYLRGSAEWEAFNPSDDLIIEHEASVTDRGAAVFDHSPSNQG
jgi:hypothetical protein